MKKKILKSFALFLAASMIFGSVPVTAQPASAAQTIKTGDKRVSPKKDTDNTYAEGEAIVLYNTRNAKATLNAISSMDKSADIVKSYDFEPSGSVAKAASALSNGGITVALVKSETLSTEALIEKLKKNNNVKYAEPNFRIQATDAADYSKFQWALDNRGQNGGTAGLDVNADAVSTDSDDTTRVVAIVDTGIDYTHPDLANVIWNNPCSSSKFKGEHGYDFINYDEDPIDDNGHGSHCAGIIAASAGDNAGISGVATASNIKLMGLKILDDMGYGYGMEAVGAYNYIYKAQQEGISVVAINNSWGGGGESEILAQLIDLVGENGALSVCAAGNSAENIDYAFTTPASIDSPYIISVAASNENDELATFSCYGENSVDIAAPGTNILSTVSYPVFNPGIYDNTDEMCYIYEDFSDVTLVKTVSDNNYIDEISENSVDNALAYGVNCYDGTGIVSVNSVSNVFFGEKDDNSASLEFTIKDAKEMDQYYLLFPYTVKEDNENHSASVTATVTGPSGMENFDPDSFFNFLSALYICDAPFTEEDGYMEDDEIILNAMDITESNNYWIHATGNIGSVSKGETRALAVQVYAAVDGDYTVHLDNFGISNSDVTLDQMGQYDYYNGTSMATPHVTGAVAALSNAYPDEYASSIKARLLASARKSEALEGYVSTGGVLDLSTSDQPGASVEQVYMAEENIITIIGSFLDGASVTINDTPVTPIEQTEDYILIDGTDYLNKYITICVTKGESSFSRSYTFAGGQPFNYDTCIEETLGNSSITSDGDSFYITETGTGFVSIGTPLRKEDETSLSWNTSYWGITPGLFGPEYQYCVEGSIETLTDSVYANGKLWTVTKLDVGYSEATALLCFDTNEMYWDYVAEIPEELTDVEGFSIASYNNAIYLLGGYDHNACALSKNVYKYDFATGSWTTAPSLPEGRIYAKALQSGDKLVVTLGGSDNDTAFQNLIFDGKTWTTSKETVLLSNLTCLDYDDSVIVIANGQVGTVDGGLVYTDCFAEGLGDTYTYNINSDSYAGTGYSLNSSQLAYTQLYATTVQNELYVIYESADSYYDEEWDEYYGSSELLSIPVDTGFVNVIDNSDDGATITNYGYRIPGDTVPVNWELYDEDYFFKDITASEGTIIKPSEESDMYHYTVPAKPTAESISLGVRTGAYVTDVVLPENLLIAQGESITLTPEITPANAENKNLIWESSNPSVVSVDQTGKLTASKDAAVDTDVVITVKTEDRGLIMSELSVVITAKTPEATQPTQPEAPKEVKPAVGSKKTIKKCTYKVLTNSDSSKTVAFVSLNNKKATSISVPATVKIDGKTFKVTKIEKNAFKDCKKLKTVKIGKNVTSIGKNAFKNCSKLNKIKVYSKKITTIGTNKINKKVTIDVPNTMKKKYQKLFKKAGYKGTVK